MPSDPAPPKPALPPTDALGSAVRFLQRGVRPDGTPEDGSEWEIASHQWGLFISWAYHRGVALPASLSPDLDGGPEHDLLLDAANARWLKFTKPFSAGFTLAPGAGNDFARRPATPLQYLRRWRLLNRVFGTDVRLAGLSCVGRTQRIVVSQPSSIGGPPTWDEIEPAWEQQHGLRRMPTPPAPADDTERRAYQAGRLALFDVLPSECARTSDGRIVPYGAIPWISSRIHQQINILRQQSAHLAHDVATQ